MARSPYNLDNFFQYVQGTRAVTLKPGLTLDAVFEKIMTRDGTRFIRIDDNPYYISMEDSPHDFKTDALNIIKYGKNQKAWTFHHLVFSFLSVFVFNYPANISGRLSSTSFVDAVGDDKNGLIKSDLPHGSLEEYFIAGNLTTLVSLGTDAGILYNLDMSDSDKREDSYTKLVGVLGGARWRDPNTGNRFNLLIDTMKNLYAMFEEGIITTSDYRNIDFSSIITRESVFDPALSKASPAKSTIPSSNASLKGDAWERFMGNTWYEKSGGNRTTVNDPSHYYPFCGNINITLSEMTIDRTKNQCKVNATMTGAKIYGNSCAATYKNGITMNSDTHPNSVPNIKIALKVNAPKYDTYVKTEQEPIFHTVRAGNGNGNETKLCQDYDDLFENSSSFSVPSIFSATSITQFVEIIGFALHEFASKRGGDQGQFAICKYVNNHHRLTCLKYSDYHDTTAMPTKISSLIHVSIDRMAISLIANNNIAIARATIAAEAAPTKSSIFTTYTDAKSEANIAIAIANIAITNISKTDYDKAKYSYDTAITAVIQAIDDAARYVSDAKVNVDKEALTIAATAASFGFDITPTVNPANPDEYDGYLIYIASIANFVPTIMRYHDAYKKYVDAVAVANSISQQTPFIYDVECASFVWVPHCKIPPLPLYPVTAPKRKKKGGESISKEINNNIPMIIGGIPLTMKISYERLVELLCIEPENMYNLLHCIASDNDNLSNILKIADELCSLEDSDFRFSTNIAYSQYDNIDYSRVYSISKKDTNGDNGDYIDRFTLDKVDGLGVEVDVDVPTTRMLQRTKTGSNIVGVRSHGKALSDIQVMIYIELLRQDHATLQAYGHDMIDHDQDDDYDLQGPAKTRKMIDRIDSIADMDQGTFSVTYTRFHIIKLKREGKIELQAILYDDGFNATQYYANDNNLTDLIKKYYSFDDAGNVTQNLGDDHDILEGGGPTNHLPILSAYLSVFRVYEMMLCIDVEQRLQSFNDIDKDNPYHNFYVAVRPHLNIFMKLLLSRVESLSKTNSLDTILFGFIEHFLKKANTPSTRVLLYQINDLFDFATKGEAEFRKVDLPDSYITKPIYKDTYKFFAEIFLELEKKLLIIQKTLYSNTVGIRTKMKIAKTECVTYYGLSTLCREFEKANLRRATTAQKNTELAQNFVTTAKPFLTSLNNSLAVKPTKHSSIFNERFDKQLNRIELTAYGGKYTKSNRKKNVKSKRKKYTKYNRKKYTRSKQNQTRKKKPI